MAQHEIEVRRPDVAEPEPLGLELRGESHVTLFPAVTSVRGRLDLGRTGCARVLVGPGVGAEDAPRDPGSSSADSAGKSPNSPGAGPTIQLQASDIYPMSAG